MADVAAGVVEELAERLRERVLSGEAAAGSWLRQERLAADFGVSRTPIREALRALHAEGLVEVVPRRGALVCGPTLRDVREAYALRAELEGYAAQVAATWAGDAQRAQMAQAAELFRRSALEDSPAPGRRPRWSEANDLFHEAVLDAAGNQRLKTTIRALHRSFPRNVTWSTLSGNHHLLQENVDQHRAVLAAIEARDPAGARAAMTAHVLRAGELVALRFERLQATG